MDSYSGVRNKHTKLGLYLNRAIYNQLLESDVPQTLGESSAAHDLIKTMTDELANIDKWMLDMSNQYLYNPGVYNISEKGFNYMVGHKVFRIEVKEVKEKKARVRGK